MYYTILTLFLVCSMLAPYPSSCQQSESLWSKMTLQDLAMIHNILNENTVAALNDAEFQKWLEEGYKEARLMAEKVNDFDGYLAALKRYSSGFYDAHVRVYPLYQPIEMSWAGFLLRYEEGKYVVFHVVNDGKDYPKVNDTLTHIDGMDIKNYMRDTLFKYDEFNPDLDAGWVRSSSAITLRKANPFIPLPKQYSISSEGKARTLNFNWGTISTCHGEELVNSSYKPVKNDFGIRDFMDGEGAWISIPTFNIKNDEQINKMQTLLEQIPQYLQKKFLVIDVRGNGGGNSEWGTSLLKQIYGDSFVSTKLYDLNKNTYALYRVSPSNLAYFQELLLSTNEQLGNDSSTARYLDVTINKMKEAIKNRNFGTVQLGPEPPSSLISDTMEPKFKGKLYFLTSTSCGSSCLTFADQLFQMPQVIHIGYPTAADTFYVESRSVALPSKNARLQFPINMDMERRRGSNVQYNPAHRYMGNINDTQNIEKWLIDLISKKS